MRHDIEKEVAALRKTTTGQVCERFAQLFGEAPGGYTLNDEEASIGAKKVLGEAKDKTVQLAEVHAAEQAPDYQPVAVEHTIGYGPPDRRILRQERRMLRNGKNA